MAITRRDFLKYTAVSGAALYMGIFNLDPIKAHAEANPPLWANEAVNICPYCGCGCGMIIGSVDGIITYVQGDPENPINLGALCPKGANAGQLNHIEDYVRPVGIADTTDNSYVYKADDSERIITPLRRDSGATNWTAISWDTALSEIAGKINLERNTSLVSGGGGYRLDTIAALGTAKDNNEECYLFTKLMRALGITYLEHCARV